MNKKKRPLLQNLLQEGTSEIESFQNTTIRPIVKMQHQLLLISFKNYLQKRKIDFENYSEKEKLNQINAIINKGHIVQEYLFRLYYWSFFNSKEYDICILNHSSEIHKRIIKIIQKRFLDSIE